MELQKLSEMVRNIHLTTPPPTEGGLREQATSVAVSMYGRQTVLSAPETVNLAALAISMRDKLLVHEVTKGVIQMVGETDLNYYPELPPRLLESPFLVESRGFDSPLFEDTACLGGYWIEGTLYLIGLTGSDECLVAPIVPTWAGGEINATDPVKPIISNDPPEGLHEWSKQAMRFLIILSLLLEAEKTPIVPRVPKSLKKAQKKAQKKRPEAGSWSVTRLYVDAQYERRANASSGEHGSDPEHSGKTAVVVPVRGFLRRQAYGPGRQARKWIYVEGFQARRWITPQPVKRIISIHR